MKMVTINKEEDEIYQFMMDPNLKLDTRVEMVKAALSFNEIVPHMSQQTVALSVAKLVDRRKG